MSSVAVQEALKGLASVQLDLWGFEGVVIGCCVELV